MAHPFARTETSPMIAAVWGEALSSAIATMIVQRPHLGRRLALAQRRVVHSLSAYILHALEQGLEASAIAANVDTRGTRELLAEAVPSLHPRLYRLFDRLCDKSKSLTFYLRANECLWGPASDLLLSTNEMVDESYLRVAEVVVSDPVLLAFRAKIGRSDGSLCILRSLIAFTRATGLSADLEKLPPGSGWRALTRRITADLGRASAPPLPFRCPEGWRPVEKLEELFRLGKQLQNCVAKIGGGGEDHFVQFVMGREIFFVSDREPITLAAVQSVGPNLWQISEMADATRRLRVPSQFQELSRPLDVVLAEVGHMRLETSPASALQALGWRVEDEVGNLDEDDEVGEAA